MPVDLLALGAALLAGLFGGVHCLAMCGGIAVGFAAPRGEGALRHALLLNAGRVGGYVLAGALVGGFGAALLGAARLPGLALAMRALVGAVSAARPPSACCSRSARPGSEGRRNGSGAACSRYANAGSRAPAPRVRWCSACSGAGSPAAEHHPARRGVACRPVRCTAPADAGFRTGHLAADVVAELERRAPGRPPRTSRHPPRCRRVDCPRGRRHAVRTLAGAHSDAAWRARRLGCRALA
jgi:hypothetical protein